MIIELRKNKFEACEKTTLPMMRLSFFSLQPKKCMKTTFNLHEDKNDVMNLNLKPKREARLSKLNEANCGHIKRSLGFFHVKNMWKSFHN